MQSQAVCAVRKQCFRTDSTHNKVEGEGGKMGISQGEGGVWHNKCDPGTIGASERSQADSRQSRQSRQGLRVTQQVHRQLVDGV